MDTRTTQTRRIYTDKKQKRGNWVHAFNTGFDLDIQQDMVKDEVSRRLN